MDEAEKLDEQKKQDRESYVRWQELALTQLGNTINLMITLAGATVAFAAKTLVDSKSILLFPEKEWICFSLAFAVSVLIGISATVTRLLDFRYSRRAARARMNCNDKERDEFHGTADKWGTCTWILFYCQAATFAFGVVRVIITIWNSYGRRI